MATYYMDTAGSNTSPYDTWAKAATSLQTVADLAVAGEIVYMRGTQVLAAVINLATNSGSLAAGWIKFIGCNAAGNNDGTQFVLDGNGAVADCVLTAGIRTYIWIENITFQNSTGDGLHNGSTYDTNWMIKNCRFNDNAAYGRNGYIRFVTVIKSQFNSNAYGAYRYYESGRISFCEFKNNTTVGQYDYHGGVVVFGCLFHNVPSGFVSENAGHTTIANCIFDGCSTVGASLAAANGLVVGNRFTNCGVGLDNISSAQANCGGYDDWNYFDNNTTDVSRTTPVIDGGDNDLADVDGAPNYGYTDLAGDDFNLAATATMRSVPIPID